MSLIKTVLFITIFLISTAYIYYTKDYYEFCTFGRITGDYLLDNEDKNEFFKSMCEDVFKDYSKHSIMKHSLFLFYSIISDIKGDLNEHSRLKYEINRMNVYSMKIEFKTLKLFHLVFYLLTLYLLIMSIPRTLLDIVYYFLYKIPVIFFIFFLIEAILYIYLDINIDILKLFSICYNYIPFNTIVGFLYSFFEMTGKNILQPGQDIKQEI